MAEKGDTMPERQNRQNLRVRSLRAFKAVGVWFLIAGLLLAASPQLEAGAFNCASPHEPNEILVGLRSDIALQTVQPLASSVHARVLSTNRDIHVLRLEITGKALDPVIRALERNPNVEYAEPNFLASVAGDPSDPFYSYQWDLERVSASDAWTITKGSSGIKVAVLDTGIQDDHPDLLGKVIAAKNFSNSPSTADSLGHGTHVAGIVGAVTDNDEGVASIGYATSLMNVKVLNDSGFGTYSALADGIVWAAKNDAQVINMSLGGAASSKTLERAVKWADRRGVILVAAAGNGGSDVPYFPAALEAVIAVASTDYGDELSPYSNRGGWVAVAAPGGPIWSATNDSGYGYKAGTSMAAPHVSGLVALVLSRFPDVQTAIQCVLTTADDVGLSMIAGGRINALRAVQCQ